MKHEFQYPKNNAEINANRWVEITLERYDDLLGCVPPARWIGKAFAVGEPMNDTDDGRVVHRACVGPIDGKYYTKPYPLVAFDPAVFINEIENQLKVGQFARSVETGWVGKVLAVEGSGIDAMLKMEGVNNLVRLMKGGDIEDSIDHDDVQWFSPDDVKFLKLV